MKNLIKLALVLSVIFYNSLISFADSEDSTVMEKALTPVGWAIGGAIAPVYLGAEYTKRSLSWTTENVVLPAGFAVGWVYEKSVEDVGWLMGRTLEGMAVGAKYTVVPVAKGIGWGMDKTYDYALHPGLLGLYHGTKYTYEYGIEPVAESINWVADNSIDCMMYGLNHSIVPFGRGSVWVAKNGTKYVIIPTYNGVKDGVVFVAVPVGKGIKYGGKYTYVPLTKGLNYGTEALGSGIDWTYDKLDDGMQWSTDNIFYPVGYGIGKSVDAVVIPVSKSAGTVSRATKRTTRKILGK